MIHLVAQPLLPYTLQQPEGKFDVGKAHKQGISFVVGISPQGSEHEGKEDTRPLASGT